MNVQSISLNVTLITAISTSAFAGPAVTGSNHQLDREINTTLHLESSWHTTLEISDAATRRIAISIPLENMTYTLELEPYSVRADAYSLFMQDDDGELYEVEPGPIRTLRGSLVELAGSRVSGTLMDDGLYARIILGDGTEYWMEPVGHKIDIAPSDLYAFYRNDDIIPSGGSCAAEDHADVATILNMLANYDTTSQSNRGGVLEAAEIACDADYEYYQDWGSQTESRIESVINSLNQQYESQVNLRHEITTIIVRSSANDPYTSSDAGTLLDQFRSQWNNNHGSISRDVAHLFTGRSLNSGTIGIAWLGVVCNTGLAYSLVESDCCGSFGCTTDLSAHELGHNWNAGHCNCTNNTMNPYIVCANDFTQGSINSINSYANSVNCLSNASPQGACCLSGNNCVMAYEDICVPNGGTYQGDNVECADATCADPIGACCIDTTCTDYSELDCSNAGGTYQGDNVGCTSGTCADPVGACCIDGACADYSESDCSNAGGIYAGDETNCNTTGCSLGACCVGIDCSLTLLNDCSGSWFGDGTTCADTSCGVGSDQLNYELRTWSKDNGQSMETYDLYFPSSDSNTRLIAVFGENADLIQLRGWSNALFDNSANLVALHQSPYGNDGPHDRVFDDPFGLELEFDSYVTIGATDLVDSNMTMLGFDSTGFNSDAGLEMDNGVWFLIPDDPMASEGAGTALGHRMMSISVESGQGLELLVNVQWFDGANVVHENRNIYWNNEGLGGGSDCPTDLDGNGSTDVSDLLMIISAWGPCSGCVEDIDGNDVVDVSDLLALIAAWGACE